MGAAVLVGAGVALLGAACAMAFLPGRKPASEQAGASQPAMVTPDGQQAIAA